MKISESTLKILKNFAEINPSIIIPTGNTLKTISVSNTILAEAHIEESFDKEFGIYYLQEFVNSINKNTELELNDDYVLINDAGGKAKYFYVDPCIITSPEKEINMPPATVEFNLTSDQLEVIKSYSVKWTLPDLCIRGDGTQCTAIVKDKKNESSNEFALPIGPTTSNYNMYLKIDNMKILPGNYKISIAKEGLSKFEIDSGKVIYWLALETDSNFEE